MHGTLRTTLLTLLLLSAGITAAQADESSALYKQGIALKAQNKNDEAIAT